MIQCQVINYILDKKDSSFFTLNNLTADFFSDYTSEFEFIFNHYNTYGCIPDKETFASRFSTFDFIEVKENPSYLLDELYEDRNKRYLASTFNDVRKCLLSGDTESALDIFTKSQEKLVASKHLECVDLMKDLSRYEDYCDRLKTPTKFYVTTGFPELDNILGGWDRREELGTIFARTNQGKSWILLKCALEAAKVGLRVGIYSGEMSENKVGYRIDTLFGNLSNKAIVHGLDGVQNSYKSYIDTYPQTLKGSLIVITPTMIGGIAGVNALRAFIEKENLDMLCIDQHSLLDDDRHAKNAVDRASNISKDLKTLQVLKKIPIITVSQQNRNDTADGIDSTHIAQSDRIAQDSTVLIAFENKDGIITLNLVKSRDSERGIQLKYAIDLDHGVFRFEPNEDDATGGDSCEDVRKEFEEDTPF